MISFEIFIIVPLQFFLLLLYRILNASLIILRKQYIALKNAGLANGVITDDFREFEQLIQREKAVVWADQMVEEEPQQNDQPKMSAIMAFPQLASNRNSPCCKYITNLCFEMLQCAGIGQFWDIIGYNVAKHKYLIVIVEVQANKKSPFLGLLFIFISGTSACTNRLI